MTILTAEDHARAKAEAERWEARRRSLREVFHSTARWTIQPRSGGEPEHGSFLVGDAAGEAKFLSAQAAALKEGRGSRVEVHEWSEWV